VLFLNKVIFIVI